MEKKVKGTIFSEYVRMIKANRELDWDEYLTDEEWKLVNEMILPSSWYPLESYKRMGLAVFKLMAKGDVKAAWNWGRLSVEGLTKVYKNLVSEGDPYEAVRRFTIIQGNLANFDIVELKKQEDRVLHVVFNVSFGGEADKAYAYHLGGMLERLAELNSSDPVKVDIIEKCWEGAPKTLFEIRW